MERTQMVTEDRQQLYKVWTLLEFHRRLLVKALDDETLSPDYKMTALFELRESTPQRVLKGHYWTLLEDGVKNKALSSAIGGGELPRDVDDWDDEDYKKAVDEYLTSSNEFSGLTREWVELLNDGDSIAKMIAELQSKKQNF